MMLNGKRDGFTLAEFQACAKAAVMKRGRAGKIIEKVQATVKHRPDFAAEAKLADKWRDPIQHAHRLFFSKQ